MNSIRKKITVCLMATVLVALVAVGAASSALSYRSTVATVDQMMSETAVLAAQRIEQELTAYKNVAMDTGCIPQLSDDSASQEEKRAIIKNTFHTSAESIVKPFTHFFIHNPRRIIRSLSVTQIADEG